MQITTAESLGIVSRSLYHDSSGALATGEAGAFLLAGPELPIPSLGAWRLTLTAGFLKTARSIYFLVSGESKREALRRVQAKDSALPASWLNLERTVFLVSREAVETLRV